MYKVRREGKILINLICLVLAQSLLAADIHQGTYSLATEAGWTAWFKLEGKGRATVMPRFDTEEFDDAVANAPKQKSVKGVWKQTSEGIEISYNGVTDSFKYQAQCDVDSWLHPCFYFVKTSGDKKSLLKYEQPYVNWDIENAPPKELSKDKLSKCEKECHDLAAKKELKKGMDASACIKEVCKPNPPAGGYY